ncbi:MAG: hypothetical protein SCALA702_26500 [Melioribacteraceae bacterium]|nr:MAG: hypothetical protein SCALA702_26500 [Melioribacteraceae bacterium]
MPKLSLCMIVKNEENYLGDCLKSVKEVVDEIVIVDTGSSDNTVNIAREYGAKIFHFEWINDFSAARNYALSKTTGDWILYLDADERLAPESYNEVSEIKRTTVKAGFYCNVISFDEHNSKPNIIRYNRLFKNSADIRFEGKIHEQIVHSLKKNEYELFESGVKIFHEGYNIPQHMMLEKANRNLELLLEEYKKDKTDYVIFQIAQTYGVLIDNEKAIEYFDKIIKSPTSSNHFKSHAFRYKAAVEFQNNKNIDKALEFALKAEKFFDREPILNSLLTKIYLNKKEFSKSVFYARKALEVNRSDDNVEFRLNLDENALLLIALQASIEGELSKDFDYFYEEFKKVDKGSDKNISYFVDLVNKLKNNLSLNVNELNTLPIVSNFANVNLLLAMIERWRTPEEKLNILEKFPMELRNAWYHFIKGSSLIKIGELKNAIKALEISMRNKFYNPALYFFLVSASIESGNHEKLPLYIEKAEKMFKDDPDNYSRIMLLKNKLTPLLKGK